MVPRRERGRRRTERRQRATLGSAALRRPTTGSVVNATSTDVSTPRPTSVSATGASSLPHPARSDTDREARSSVRRAAAPQQHLPSLRRVANRLEQHRATQIAINKSSNCSSSATSSRPASAVQACASVVSSAALRRGTGRRCVSPSCCCPPPSAPLAARRWHRSGGDIAVPAGPSRPASADRPGGGRRTSPVARSPAGPSPCTCDGPSQSESGRPAATRSRRRTQERGWLRQHATNHPTTRDGGVANLNRGGRMNCGVLWCLASARSPRGLHNQSNTQRFTRTNACRVLKNTCEVVCGSSQLSSPGTE